ncbi:uncharacterized protein LOC133531042 isoform X2 [Cydia pomonella]|uniref:uncharacterized protein LOC133531042 isoform X2 n=1 Tax=Cydia pomonella TaxID=82600 RepID=UPI002ADD9318|nr:uncharacterized protein LOC133531042 isoform X2 [Cydia pomonella]
MKKYDLLKHLTHTDTDKISTNKTLNEFINMKSHYKVRAKDKIKEPKNTLSATEYDIDQSTEDNVSGIHKKKTPKGKKIYNKDDHFSRDTKIPLGYPLKLEGTTLFFTDESSENNTNETHYKRKPRDKKLFGKKDTVSSDSQEDTFVTIISQSSTTQKPIKLKENLKHKKITQKDNVDEEILRGNPKESEGSEDVKKVLVIHLDSNKNPNANQLRTPHSNEVKIPSTKKKRTTESSKFKSDIAADPNSDFEEHKVMQEEISRAKSLRQALGDACTKLVNRKCKKALKDVLTDICKKERKCSSKFNNDFTQNGIDACDEEFKNPNGKRGQNVRHDKHFRDYDDDDDDSENDDHDRDEELTGAQFIDYTRQGLLDMTCLQAISDFKKPKIAERTNVTNIDTKTHDVHILRDKLENACRKASFEKCNKACKSASKKTCKKHECVTAKEKALGKSCKKRCMESYGYHEEDSSESDSSSDEDSDSY